MCGRYFLSEDDLDELLDDGWLEEALLRARRLGTELRTSGDVRPTDIAPVIATSKSRARGAFPMRWGLLHPTRGTLVINARSETAAQSPLFSQSAAERRCLVPAGGYFEWLKDGPKKTRHAFYGPGGTPLYLGGLYVKSGGEPLPGFVILTREAAPHIAHIHARMPVIVPQSLADDWLSPETRLPDLLLQAVTGVETRIA